MKMMAWIVSAVMVGVALQPVVVKAAEEHQHEKKVKGPNGGKVVTSAKPAYELLVTADKKIKITILGDDYKPVASSGQVVNVVCGDRAKPTKLTFVADGGAFISEQKIPDGDSVPCVVQVKNAGDEKAQTERLSLNLADCPKCSSKEYACTCVHEGCSH